MARINSNNYVERRTTRRNQPPAEVEVIEEEEEEMLGYAELKDIFDPIIVRAIENRCECGEFKPTLWTGMTKGWICKCGRDYTPIDDNCCPECGREYEEEK